jgi:hypothetical protein
MRRAAKLVAGALGLVLVLGVVIHLPPVMHWLGAHGHHGAGVCPLGYGAQPQHVAVAPSKDGVARRALGFELGITTAADVERWGLLHGIQCREQHHGTGLQCDNVPSALLGDVTTPPAALMFSLDSASAIRSIQVTRRGPEVATIAGAFVQLSHELAVANGSPTKHSGSADASDLARGALRQAMVEYSAHDYRAVVRATNMGDGFVLTEQYALID